MLNIENNPQKDVTRTNLQCDISDFVLTKVNYVDFSSQKRGVMLEKQKQDKMLYIYIPTLYKILLLLTEILNF